MIAGGGFCVAPGVCCGFAAVPFGAAIGGTITGAVGGIIGALPGSILFALPAAIVASYTREFRGTTSIEQSLGTLTKCNDLLTQKYVIEQIYRSISDNSYQSLESSKLANTLKNNRNNMALAWPALLEYMQETTFNFDNEKVYVHDGKKLFNQILDILGNQNLQGCIDLANNDQFSKIQGHREILIQRDSSGMNLLHHTVKENDTKNLPRLLHVYNKSNVGWDEIVIHPDETGIDHGKTALLMAIGNDNTSVIDEFINAGMAKEDIAIQAITHAITEEKIRGYNAEAMQTTSTKKTEEKTTIIEHLVINHKLDVNLSFNYYGEEYTLLKYADAKGYVKNANLLVAHGANDPETDKMRKTLSLIAPIVLAKQWNTNGTWLWSTCTPSHVGKLQYTLKNMNINQENCSDTIQTLNRDQIRKLFYDMKNDLVRCNPKDNLSGNRSTQAQNLYSLVKEMDEINEDDAVLRGLYNWAKMEIKPFAARQIRVNANRII